MNADNIHIIMTPVGRLLICKVEKFNDDGTADIKNPLIFNEKVDKKTGQGGIALGPVFHILDAAAGTVGVAEKWPLDENKPDHMQLLNAYEKINQQLSAQRSGISIASTMPSGLPSLGRK